MIINYLNDDCTQSGENAYMWLSAGFQSWHVINVGFTQIFYTYQMMEWLSIVFVIHVEASHTPESLLWFYGNDNKLNS